MLNVLGSPYPAREAGFCSALHLLIESVCAANPLRIQNERMFKMKSFMRSFGLTFSVVLIVLSGAFASVLISAAAESSGFSSGEFLLLGFKNGVLFGEAFGEKFSLDFAPAAALAQKLQPLAVLLPPWYQLLLRYLVKPW